MRKTKVTPQLITFVLNVHKQCPEMSYRDIVQFVKDQLGITISNWTVGTIINAGSVEGYEKAKEDKRKRATILTQNDIDNVEQMTIGIEEDVQDNTNEVRNIDEVMNTDEVHTSGTIF